MDSLSNFYRQAIAIPVFYNMALLSQPRVEPYFHMNNTTLRLAGIAEEETPLSIIGKAVNFIPRQRHEGKNLIIELGEEIEKAGHYQLQRGEETLRHLSFNYNRNESALEYYTKEELQQIDDAHAIDFEFFEEEKEELIHDIESQYGGTPLWKYFIILALIFLGLEILWLRIF